MPLDQKNPQNLYDSGDQKGLAGSESGLWDLLGCRYRERIVGNTLGVLVRPY